MVVMAVGGPAARANARRASHLRLRVMLEWRYIPFHVHTEMAQTGLGGTGMAPPANWFVVAPPGTAALPVVAGASCVDR